MAIISIPNTFTVGQTIVASQHNSNFSTIYNQFNGLIDTTNISPTAAIADTQLAQISTASKISGAALTLLPNIPSGAGLIPVANIPTGTTANKVVVLDGSAKLPAVDGSALTNLNFGTPITGLSVNTVYQAASAGFVFISVTTNTNSISIVTDSSNPPTTTKGALSGVVVNLTMMVPIISGNYYKATGGATINVYEFWPL